MACNETLIDAPVTPAPVFAYRALRAVIWGEEETPEKPSAISPGKKIQRSPASQLDRARTAVQLTPGVKRKLTTIAQASPSKSILRTPGVHTPRRALLKDLNVTFENVRKSVSPQLKQGSRQPGQHRREAEQDKENRPVGTMSVKHGVDEQAKSVRVTIREHPSSTVAPNRASSVQQSGPESSSTPPLTINNSIFDAEAYMRNTEKEMKKLIRYGQFMRDCARRQGEENSKLRVMLDELRNENDRLKQQLDKFEPSKATTAKIHAIPDKKELETGREAASKPNEKAVKHSTLRKPIQVADLLDIDEKPSPNPQPNQHSTSTKRSRSAQTLTSELNTTLTTTTQPSLPDSDLPDAHTTVRTKKQRHTTKPDLPPNSPHLPTRQHSVNLPLRPLSNGTTHSRLAPDRLAAARARVKKKAEMRKASADVVGGVGGGSSAIEASLVDWAAL